LIISLPDDGMSKYQSLYPLNLAATPNLFDYDLNNLIFFLLIFTSLLTLLAHAIDVYADLIINIVLDVDIYTHFLILFPCARNHTLSSELD
jgi:hypothetical protein